MGFKVNSGSVSVYASPRFRTWPLSPPEISVHHFKVLRKELKSEKATVGSYVRDPDTVRTGSH